MKGVEHLAVVASLASLRADVLHVQWLAFPQLDAQLRFRSPSVFTAHDLLPRRTASKRGLWRRILRRFDRVVVHSGRGREALADLGIDATVIPHPVYPSAAQHADDGHTILSLGVIRPYKGLSDAIEVTRRLTDTRLLVAGDPAMPLDGLRTAERVEWRLGYLPPAELDRALADATVAVFPYRAELDQSGALLQALGAGVPAVAYDVGGPGRADRVVRCREGRAGQRRRRSDRRRARAARRPRRALRRANGRGARARRAHLGRGRRSPSRALPRADVIGRRPKFDDVIQRQLDGFERDHADVLEEARGEARRLQRRRA